MTTVRQAAFLLAAVAMLAACGGGAGSVEEMRAVLTEDGCTYEGSLEPTAGMFTIDVENDTEYFGAFAVASLANGSTVGDLEPYLEKARQQFAANGTLPELPPFYEQVARSGIEAGESGYLPVDVAAGTYALMCFVDDLPTWRVYAAAELDVT